tara:strand:- start:572 stop:1231 length:660 start_codon:yes stop_codon:yes gene_type:complete
MKKTVIFFLCLPLYIFSQNSHLTYDQANDVNIVKQYKNNTEINSYLTKDGLTIKVGDTLTIGNAVIERKKYMFGDVFSHIVVGKAKGVNKEFTYLPYNYSGDKVVVKSIFVTHKKETGYVLWTQRNHNPLYVSVFVKNPKSELTSAKEFSKLLSHSRKTIIDIDKALASKEIINPNALLSKEEAIYKLKESKDLMELDLLSKEEYEKLKERLTPIILGE